MGDLFVIFIIIIIFFLQVLAISKNFDHFELRGREVRGRPGRRLGEAMRPCLID